MSEITANIQMVGMLGAMKSVLELQPLRRCYISRLEIHLFDMIEDS
jgi:hypothetical protein